MGVEVRNDVEKLIVRIKDLSIGLITSDFSKLHDIVSIADEMDLSLTIIDPEKGTVREMDCVLADDPLIIDATRLRTTRIVEMMDDPNGSVQRAIASSLDLFEPCCLTIGIDPGKRPGAAFLSDGRLASVYKSPTPESVVDRIALMIEALMPEEFRIRIGNGDPGNRDRIMNSLRKRGFEVELVDESMTTTARKFRDETSAVAIAMTEGPVLGSDI